MERVKRRKSMFHCLSGGNEENMKRRSVNLWSPSDATSNKSLFKFEVGRSTSKPRKQIKKLFAKGVSSARSILKRKHGHSSVRHTTYQKEEEETSPYYNPFFHQEQGDEMLSHHIHHSNISSSIKFGRKEESSSDNSSKGTVDHYSDYCRMDIECSTRESVIIPSPMEDVNVFASESTEDINIHSTSKIIFNQNDRLICSLPKTSSPSLISEATNRIIERWEMTQQHEDVIMVSTHGETLSFGREEMRPAELDNMVGLSEIIDVDDKELLSEGSEGITSIQFSGPELEYHESLKEVDHHSQLSVLEAPNTKDLPSNSEIWETINSQFRELKKQLHVLRIPPKATSRDLREQRSEVESLNLEYLFLVLTLKEFDILETKFATLTTPSPWEAIHYPSDPTLFYRLEKYYYGGERLSGTVKNLFHKYIETTFMIISKSMLRHSWVSPEKREHQLTLTKFRIEDQILKVLDEIEAHEIVKDDDQIAWANLFDKDPEWLQPNNEIDNLGNLLAELILNDLVLEVIN